MHHNAVQRAPKNRCADKGLGAMWCHSFNLALPGPLILPLHRLVSLCIALQSRHYSEVMSGRATQTRSERCVAPK